ncbi:MAG TPA: aspartate/glutamate racemase family protein [Propionibacteriaceae bacterium]|nr:aspartate/glutamate racemase family protein [Propionibacteriaceae bacterium]
MTRIALLHTGAVNIAPFGALTRAHWPGVETMNLLDDKIVADLPTPRAPSVAERLQDLVGTAVAAGADAVLLTCSSISEYAAGLSREAGIPVLRVDEAVADAAVAAGRRIAVIATLPTTLGPSVRLVQERAALAGAEPEVSEVLVDGAFEAVAAGDTATPDRLVGEAVVRAAASSDVVVLAQASMATAAQAVTVSVPVLTSPEPAVLRAKEVLGL